VGVFTQPSPSQQGDCGGNCLYLAASYVKFIESAGARVVPINYYASEEELDKLFDSLNGFLFVGGGSAFPPSAQYIFDKTKQSNDNGDYIPLFGICMGFQWLLLSAADGQLRLDPSDGTQMDAENYSIPLDFVSQDKIKQSHLFQDASENIMKILSTDNVTMNNHHYGIYPEHFDTTPALSDFYNILSLNKDRQGVAFVSTMEAKKYPIYGTQWHPEKNIFEWQMVMPNGEMYEAINHSYDAILISQYISNFFIQQARRSTHKFSSAQVEDNSLIYNYQAVKTTGDFVQKYFFKNDFKSFVE
jgi:gamma-glutamyl hydrolase